MEQPTKGALIRRGLNKSIKAEYPEADHAAIDAMAYGALSCICGQLTDSDKGKREWAKKEVRRLVKLGKEQS